MFVQKREYEKTKATDLYAWTMTYLDFVDVREGDHDNDEDEGAGVGKLLRKDPLLAEVKHFPGLE